MISLTALDVTLTVLIIIVALTTIAAVVNKIHTNREDDTRRRFLDRLRKNILLLSGGSEDKALAYREIGAALSGRWSQLAAEEISQLELTTRLEVIRSIEEQGVLTRYIRDVKSPLKWTRAHALRLLGELKVPASVPALLEALEDRDPDVRIVAARSLGRMRLQAAEEALVAQLGRHEQAVSARIAAICIQMGARTGPLLIKTLRDAQPKARFWAARILGEIKESRACRSLGDALLDPDPDVRSASAWALGSIADRETAPLVETALRDPVWFVRAHAAEALGKLGDTSMTDSVAELLSDRSWWVRKNALDALVRLGEPSMPALYSALESEDRFERDSAVEALTTLGVPLESLPRRVAAAGG